MNKWIILLAVTVLIISCKNTATLDEAVKKEELGDQVMMSNTFFGYDLNQFKVDSGIVKRNETLNQILPEYGVDYEQVHEIGLKCDGVIDVRKIKAGDKYFCLSPLDTLEDKLHFIYVKDKVEYAVVSVEDSISVTKYEKPITIERRNATGIISSSMWNAFIEQGLSPNLFAEVVRLFQWTIDFFDTKVGDNFKVIYDEKFVEGESIGIDHIHGLVFQHKGRDYYAFRYENEGKDFVYYTEKGESLKRVLLSAPLQYRRISSRFSNRRFHPVLKYYRPHHGVDYAAPTGTPVVATGSGKVTFAGRSGGAGKMVKIKHNAGNIETRYLHLHRFAPGIRKGAIVSQGQKIGEVGSTGLSTGPHLDYRVYINRKAVDPLGINIPTADPLGGSALDSFMVKIKPLKIELDRLPVPELGQLSSNN